MDQNRPKGREKHVTEGGSGVHRRGDGLGTGPVGSQNGYSGKPQSGGGGKRAAAAGGGGTLILLLVVFMMMKGCNTSSMGGGGDLTDLLGGGAVGELPYHSEQANEQQYSAPDTDTTPVDNTTESAADSEDLNVIKADKGITDFDYEGTWACDRCTIDIVYKGEYDVLIDWGNSADESEQWSYSCFYDPQARTLICEAAGSHTKIITGEDGSTDVEKDGTDMSATFYIKDGKLIWLRDGEESAEPMVFERMEY